MPQRIGKLFQPKHGDALNIAHNPNGPKADLVGIHQGRGEVGFYSSVAQENITPGQRTNSGWRYYPVPEKAEFITLSVAWDQHPKINQKIISITAFLDLSSQEIPISRE